MDDMTDTISILERLVSFPTVSADSNLALIDFVARNPLTGVSVGGGVRKFRFAREGGGKSGGYRVIHFFSPDDGTPIFLITVFAKNEKDNLTKAEQAAAVELSKALIAAYGDR